MYSQQLSQIDFSESSSTVWLIVRSSIEVDRKERVLTEIDRTILADFHKESFAGKQLSVTPDAMEGELIHRSLSISLQSIFLRLF